MRKHLRAALIAFHVVALVLVNIPAPTGSALALSGHDASPDGVFARKELAIRLRKALDSLPFDQRTAIVLREIDGLSYEEIAFSLGIAIGTVKSRLTRARKALRRDLAAARTS